MLTTFMQPSNKGLNIDKLESFKCRLTVQIYNLKKPLSRVLVKYFTKNFRGESIYLTISELTFLHNRTAAKSKVRENARRIKNFRYICARNILT